MTGTGLVYGSLWDNGERGGCQDFIRPLKRAQQMPWHVRSTDAWPHARRRPLSLSLSLCRRPRLASFPPVQICISSARTPRLERSRKAISLLGPRGGHFVARRVYSRRKNTFSRHPSLPSCVGVIPLDARGRCRNDGRTVKNLEAKKSWRTKIGKTFENRRGNLVLGGEIRVCHPCIPESRISRGEIRAIQLTTDKERKGGRRG